jgi:hypothetical protein
MGYPYGKQLVQNPTPRNANLLTKYDRLPRTRRP